MTSQAPYLHRLPPRQLNLAKEAWPPWWSRRMKEHHSLNYLNLDTIVAWLAFSTTSSQASGSRIAAFRINFQSPQIGPKLESFPLQWREILPYWGDEKSKQGLDWNMNTSCDMWARAVAYERRQMGKFSSKPTDSWLSDRDMFRPDLSWWEVDSRCVRLVGINSVLKILRVDIVIYQTNLQEHPWNWFKKWCGWDNVSLLSET